VPVLLSFCLKSAISGVYLGRDNPEMRTSAVLLRLRCSELGVEMPRRLHGVRLCYVFLQ
jgi:hypothetical protein